MNDYGGEDRRQKSMDHDLLLELKGILLQQNAIMAGQKEAADTHVKAFEKHVEDDKIAFNAIWKLVGQLRWYVAMGMGILIALEFASKFISHKGN